MGKSQETPDDHQVRIGIDIGGTFTDFALFNAADGRLSTHKQLTTSADPSVCVLDGTDVLLERAGHLLEDVSTIVHGTTLITNALIERKGARTGMLVTEGFLDVLDVGMESRYDLFDLRIGYAEPVVPRGLRYGIPERVHHDGRVEIPLDVSSVEASVTRLVQDDGVEALAICFLHSYIDPKHENLAAEIVRRLFPDLPVCCSADVVPVMREFERWSTATVNAYTQPLADRYLGRIEAGLSERGFNGAFLVMTSSGGALDATQARNWPVRLIESGPAAGALMAAFVGSAAGEQDVLSFDMGGTTAKGAIVKGGVPLKRYRLEAAREHEYKAGSGIPLRIPVIDMIEIGAGGGSLASVDERGLLAVGPQSAGASPGPACYAQGGEKPTLTDANVLLGHLIPERFLGGEMPLERERADAAFTRVVCRPLQLELARAAWGTYEVINEDVSRAFRMHASEIGMDYRHCTMVAFGGSGPIHALRVARNLRIPRVIFPPAAGVMSAVGLLVAPLSVELMRSERIGLSALDCEQMSARFDPLKAQATAFLEHAGAGVEDIEVRYALDMRYAGQGYEVEVPLPANAMSGKTLENLAALFSARYAEVFSDVTLPHPLEIVNWKVEAKAPQPGVDASYGLGFFLEGQSELGTHPVFDPVSGAHTPCPVLDRYTLGPGTELSGPLLLQEKESTCVIGAGELMRVDQALNIVVELDAERSGR